MNPGQEVKPLVQLTVNDNLIQQQQQMQMNQQYPAPLLPIRKPIPSNYPYVYNPVQGIVDPNAHNYPWTYMPNNPPLVKKYNLNLGGAFGNHREIAKLYEDIIPAELMTDSSLTVSQREKICNYIRSTLVTMHDGEDINLTRNLKKKSPEVRRRNLLGYLKTLGINPYQSGGGNRVHNPYKLQESNNFTLFQSCYPVRLNPRHNIVQCAKDSVGMNLRIYSISNDEANANTVKNSDINKFDIWRETKLYNHIKEHILNKKKCPNFAMMYSWFIAQDSGINFDQLNELHDRYRNRLVADPGSRLYHEGKLVTFKTKEIEEELKIKDDDEEKVKKKKEEKRKKLHFIQNDRTCNNVIILTEAPNFGFCQWAQKQYSKPDPLNPVRRMIYTGYHNDTVWRSMIFQILFALATLEKEGIAFNENTFNLKNNVYIKDLQTHNQGQSKGVWKYKLDGFTYYIPNFGYQILIDNNYYQEGQRKGEIENHNERRFLGEFIDGESVKTIVNSWIKAGCKKIFNDIKALFSGQKIVLPGENIKELINNIINDCDTESIKDIIKNHMPQFLNNRIGTLLDKSEKEEGLVKISDDDYQIEQVGSSVKPGTLYVSNFRGNTEFVVLKEINKDGSCSIFTRNSHDPKGTIQTRTVNQSDLGNYLSANEPKQIDLDSKVLESYML